MCSWVELEKKMTTTRHNGRRKASALGKARAGRSAHVMKPEHLAETLCFPDNAAATAMLRRTYRKY